MDEDPKRLIDPSAHAPTWLRRLLVPALVPNPPDDIEERLAPSLAAKLATIEDDEAEAALDDAIKSG